MTIDGLIMTLCYVTRWINYDNCALCSNVHSVPDFKHKKKKKKKKKHALSIHCTITGKNTNKWLVPHHGLKDLTAETFCHL